MKKVIALLLCLLSVTLSLTGCSNHQEDFEEKQYMPREPIRAIYLDVRDRQIDVSASQDGQVHIAYAENSQEFYDISVSDDHVLTMTSATNKEWMDYIGTKPAAENRKISLQVPDNLLNDLTLFTTNETITLTSLSVKGNVSLSSNGGNLSFELLDVGDTLSLTAKNGHITGTVAGLYEDFSIQTHVKKGSCNLPEEKEGGLKTLIVSGNHGDVSIAFSRK